MRLQQRSRAGVDAAEARPAKQELEATVMSFASEEAFDVKLHHQHLDVQFAQCFLHIPFQVSKWNCDDSRTERTDT